MHKITDLNGLTSNPAKIDEISAEEAKNILAQIAQFTSIIPLLQIRVFSLNGKSRAVPDEYLTIQQASVRFNKPTDYFYRNQEDLPFMKKDAGRWRVSVKKYEQYFDNL